MWSWPKFLQALLVGCSGAVVDAGTRYLAGGVADVAHLSVRALLVTVVLGTLTRLGSWIVAEYGPQRV